MSETKKCEACEQEIGSNETACPKCGTVFEELEQEIKVVERAQAVVAKRKAAIKPPVIEPETPAKKKSVFSSLAGK